MNDDKELSELEYFQALFGDDLGKKFANLRAATTWFGVGWIVLASIAVLIIFPQLVERFAPPIAMLKYLPLYLEQYAQQGKSLMGIKIWWIQFTGVIFLLAQTGFFSIWLTFHLGKNRNVRFRFAKIPVLNPSLVGLIVGCLPVFTLVFSWWWGWNALILGGYKIVFGPTLFFFFFWCTGYFMSLFLIVHGCLLVAISIFKLLKALGLTI